MNTAAIKAKSEKLADLQKSLHASDQAMADKVHCTRQTWRSALNGENVSAGFVAKVSLAFQVPFDTYFKISRLEAVAA